MRVNRAFEDAPQQPATTSWFQRLLGVMTRLLERTFVPPHTALSRSDEEAWLILAASDPNGVWYPWPVVERSSTGDRTPPQS
jgi:hypothetical protein